MQVRQAIKEDVTYITKALSKTYQELNSKVGYPLFVSNADTLMGHVARRIESDDNTFSYMVAIEEEHILGCINTMIEKEKGQILILHSDDTTIATQLIEAGIQHLQKQGAKVVLAEEMPGTTSAKAMKTYGFISYTENLIYKV